MGMLNTVLMLLAVPQAQAAPPTTPTTPTAPAAPAGDARRLDQVAWLGRMLYTFDRAAWVSTDALLAKVSKDKLAGVGGYVVEPGEGEVLHVTYYMGTGDAARAFFVADVRGGKVTASTMLHRQRTEPTERSIPPVMMTSVMPSAMIATKVTLRVML